MVVGLGRGDVGGGVGGRTVVDADRTARGSFFGFLGDSDWLKNRPKVEGREWADVVADDLCAVPIVTDEFGGTVVDVERAG